MTNFELLKEIALPTFGAAATTAAAGYLANYYSKEAGCDGEDAVNQVCQYFATIGASLVCAVSFGALICCAFKRNPNDENIVVVIEHNLQENGIIPREIARGELTNDDISLLEEFINIVNEYRQSQNQGVIPDNIASRLVEVHRNMAENTRRLLDISFQRITNEVDNITNEVGNLTSIIPGTSPDRPEATTIGRRQEVNVTPVA
jgi:hypothetical protein